VRFHMNPDACWEKIMEALADGEWNEAEDKFDDLLNWLKQGGFYPIGFDAARDAARRGATLVRQQ